MSHKEGAYLGGIATLEHLRERCIIDPDTGCWHCKANKKGGIPRVVVRLVGGGYRKMQARRAALYLRDGKELPPKHIAWGKRTCPSIDCANPDHAKSGPKKQWGADLAKSGRMKNLPKKIAAARATGKLRRKLTEEQIAEQRATDEKPRDAARRLGVSEVTIREIRMMKRAPPSIMNGASVFSWRPA